MVKIVVFVPKAHRDAVRLAMGDAGAGVIGKYSHNAFSIDGSGMFKPLPGSHPTVGKVGKIEHTQEARVEAVCERRIAKEVLAAIRMVHPYEEMAFDIYPLILENEL